MIMVIVVGVMGGFFVFALEEEKRKHGVGVIAGVTVMVARGASRELGTVVK